MSERDSDESLMAFRRLLKDAAQAGGSNSKVDALVALAQRKVWVATWTSLGDDYRTLVNSNGMNALPLFTGADELEKAAHRFGWQSVDGTVLAVQVNARDMFQHAVAHSVEFTVVDIASEHCLEIGKDELEPLLSQRARRDSDGPFAGVGQVRRSVHRSATLPSGPPSNPPEAAPVPMGGPTVPAPTRIESVRVSPKEPVTRQSFPRPAAPEPPRARAVPPPAPPPVQRESGQPPAHQSSWPPDKNPERVEELLDGLNELLRNYPEIEWAALAREVSDHKRAIAVRVDTSFRGRVDEIRKEIGIVSGHFGKPLPMVLLDDAQMMRDVRSQGTIFFPWRARRTSA